MLNQTKRKQLAKSTANFRALCSFSVQRKKEENHGNLSSLKKFFLGSIQLHWSGRIDRLFDVGGIHVQTDRQLDNITGKHSPRRHWRVWREKYLLQKVSLTKLTDFLMETERLLNSNNCSNNPTKADQSSRCFDLSSIMLKNYACFSQALHLEIWKKLNEYHWRSGSFLRFCLWTQTGKELHILQCQVTHCTVQKTTNWTSSTSRPAFHDAKFVLQPKDSILGGANVKYRLTADVDKHQVANCSRMYSWGLTNDNS